MLGATNAPLHGMEAATDGGSSALRRATTWVNTPPLTAEGLRGKVVLVDFCTYTCINWLRQLPYVRAWAAKYRAHGLVVIGVHIHARDLHLVMGPAIRGSGARFRVRIDGQRPGTAGGGDIDEQGELHVWMNQNRREDPLCRRTMTKRIYSELGHTINADEIALVRAMVET